MFEAVYLPHLFSSPWLHTQHLVLDLALVFIYLPDKLFTRVHMSSCFKILARYPPFPTVDGLYDHLRITHDDQPIVDGPYHHSRMAVDDHLLWMVLVIIRIWPMMTILL